MPQFQPISQEEMLNVVKDMDMVYGARKSGPGLNVVEMNREASSLMFGGLTTNFGWYHDSTYWTEDERNKVHIIMPITEVDTDE